MVVVVHLLNGYLVKFLQAVGLRHALVDKHRIDILHIDEANQLIDSSIVTHVAFQFGIGSAPLLSRHALVLSTHSETLNTKFGNPAAILKWSNSTTLKLGL